MREDSAMAKIMKDMRRRGEFDDLDEQIMAVKEPQSPAITEPPALVQSLAKKAGVPVSRAEDYWKDAKKAAKKQYPDVDPDSDRFYKLVTGILKSMLKIKDSTEMIPIPQVPAVITASNDAVVQELVKVNARLDVLLVEFRRLVEGV